MKYFSILNLQSIHLLLTRLKMSDHHNLIIGRVNDYSRWLYQDMTSMVNSPRSIMSISATSQPKVSIVRKDMMEFIRQRKQLSDMENQEVLLRGVNLEGYDLFTPYLATFLGHIGPVYSVCISSDGSRVISGSGDKTVRLWDS